MDTSLIKWFIVVAINNRNQIVCFGSMINAQSAAIPKKCWRSGYIVAIQKLKKENESFVFYNVIGLDKEMSAQVAPEISVIKVSISSQK